MLGARVKIIMWIPKVLTETYEAFKFLSLKDTQLN